MATFPTLITDPPALSPAAEPYSQTQQKLLSVKPGSDDWNKGFQTLSNIRLSPEDQRALRAQQANVTMKRIQKTLASGTTTDLDGKTVPLTDAGRQNAEATLKELQLGRLPTKGGSIDVSTGMPVKVSKK